MSSFVSKMMNLTPETKFKISFATYLLTLSGAVGFGIKFQSTLSKINSSVSEAVSKINTVESSLTGRLNNFESLMGDRFTKTSAAEWASRMLIANPSLRVPDPREPARYLNAPSWETK